MNNIVIGIEGLVGAGKTSICRELLNKMPNSVLLNGGNLYRAIISVLLKNNMDLENLKKEIKNVDIKNIMNKLNIEIKIEESETKFYYKGKMISEDEMQSSKSSMAVSMVGGITDNTKLFDFARELIDNLRKKYNVIVSGRALMQIYPDINYHIFITATLEQRVLRKMKQYQGKMTKEEMEEHIKNRDLLQEKAGFYKTCSKSIIIDVTDCTSIQESTNKVLEYIKGD